LSRWEDIADDIARNREDGAEVLAGRALNVFEIWLKEGRHKRELDFYDDLVIVCKRLVSAQPTMATLFVLSNRMLLAVRNGLDAEADLIALRALVEDEVNAYKRNTESAREQIGRAGTRLIDQGSTILTHSASSTVEGVLLDAHARGTNFQVIATESRPTNEGIRLAERLGERGITVKFIIDAAVGLHVQHSTMVMVGADWVDHKNVVNKVGTRPLTALARAENIPTYVVTLTTKFAPLVFAPEFYDRRGTQEILPKPPKNVHASNRYYDTTPLEWFTGLITQRGVVVPQEVRTALAQARIATDLVREAPR
jgi:translation initiation factor 2B subunit (eIF-2B alpha/beta/delta family)